MNTHPHSEDLEETNEFLVGLLDSAWHSGFEQGQRFMIEAAAETPDKKKLVQLVRSPYHSD